MVSFARISRRNSDLAIRFCVASLAFCLLTCVLINLLPLDHRGAENCRFPGEIESSRVKIESVIAFPPAGDVHFLCVLVPFRDRFDELNVFVPKISHFLRAQNVHHAIFVINQVDTLRFNRASLINAGFLMSREVLNGVGSPDCDYVALHDVDLVPTNPDLSYGFPGRGPFHVAAPGLHPKYDYETFLGGILLITRSHFRLVNGMSNRYWGWGLEDDEFHRRVVEAGLTVERPANISTGKKSTFSHFHSPRVRKRDMAKCYDQHEVTRRRDRVTGLDTLDFKPGRVFRNCVDNVPYALVNVDLGCDRAKTPWCDCRNSPPTEKSKGLKRDKDVIVPIVKRKRANDLKK